VRLFGGSQVITVGDISTWGKHNDLIYKTKNKGKDFKGLTSWQRIPSDGVCDSSEDPVQFTKHCPPVTQLAWYSVIKKEEQKSKVYLSIPTYEQINKN